MTSDIATWLIKPVGIKFDVVGLSEVAGSVKWGNAKEKMIMKLIGAA